MSSLDGESQQLRDIATSLGIPVDQLSPQLIDRLSQDPLFCHHLVASRDAPEFRELLLAEANAPNASSPPQTRRFSFGSLGKVAASLSKWVFTGAPLVSVIEYDARLAVCATCRYNSHFGSKALGPATCGLCGCILAAKARLGTERCPDVEAGPSGRWSKPQSQASASC
ncbi:MAG: hypothetical protein QM576_17920 [Rhodopseudomonas sp.]|uniref:hypothetical protein n=1 Tax=Rhodopseudomonas sp. TaxID=1078 RepID=UPI0039E2A332